MSKTRRLEHKARLLRDSTGPDVVVSADKRPRGNRTPRFSRDHETLVRLIIEQAYTDPQVITIRNAYRRYCHELAKCLPPAPPMSYTAFRYRIRKWVGLPRVKHGARPPQRP